MLGNVTLYTSLSTVPKSTSVETAFGGERKPEERVILGAVLKSRPVVLVFKTESLATVALAPREPSFGDTFEMPLLEDVAFKPTGLRDEDLVVSLLGDAPSEAVNIPNVDGDFFVPNVLILGEGWVDALLIGAEIEPNTPSPRDSELLGGSRGGDPKAQLQLLGTLLVVEDPKSAKPGTPESFSAPLVSVTPLSSSAGSFYPCCSSCGSLGDAVYRSTCLDALGASRPMCGC